MITKTDLDFKGILHWAKNMGKDTSYFLMEQKFKVSGKTIISKGRQEFSIIMVITTKETFICLRKMEKEPTNGIHKKDRFNIKANLKKIALKALPL